MNEMNFIVPSFVAASVSQANSSSPGGSLMSFLVPMLLMFVVMYVILIRPQKRRHKEHQKMLDKVKSGDRVISNGGIYGTIAAVKERSLILEIADNVKIEIDRNSISAVIQDSSKQSS